MSLKAQAAGVAIGGAVILLGLWYVKRQASGALSSVGNAISGTASDAWNTATTPILDFGSGTIGSTAAGVGNGIVAAPSNALDSLSLGMISGSGGNTGNGGLWGWLSNIVSGAAFMPSGSTTGGTTDTTGIDFGTGSNTWND